MESSLLVINGLKRFVVIGEGENKDAFYVYAEDKDQVADLLIKRGGIDNLAKYKINQVQTLHTEFIIGEVDSYKTMMSFHEYLNSIKVSL
jgi:hypothetical protein